MKTTLNIHELAALLNKKVWEKGNVARIYIQGYNTNKCRQTLYIYICDGEIKFSAYTECPGQSYEWCKSQNAQAISSMETMVKEALEPEIETPDAEMEQSTPIQETQTAETQAMNEVVVGNEETCYQGCGKYAVAIRDGKITAAIKKSNFTEGTPGREILEACSKILSPFGTVFQMEGSGTKWFFGTSRDAEKSGAQFKTYTVPSATGGRVTNHELI